MSDPRTLRTALVGPHQELYFTSANFKNAVDTLANMLPSMIQGLAEESEKQDARRAEALAMFEKSVLVGEHPCLCKEPVPLSDPDRLYPVDGWHRCGKCRGLIGL